MGQEEDLTPNYARDFYRLARLVIAHCGAFVAYGIIEIASEDLANETWFGGKFVPPETEKTKEDRVMISKEWKSG